MKIVRRDNIHVVVEPDLRYLRNPKESYVDNICKTIVQQVRRHIDETGQVYIHWDSIEECEFCGYRWELDENGCPVCCQKAIDEWEEHQEQG